jgi:spore coat polysaccharide biosynthesis protein SpsF
MKKVVIIQARTGSTRLPGKVMTNLFGKTILGHIISRIKISSLIDDMIVATTSAKRDDVIVEETEKYDVRCFRGSEEDVLSRFYFASKSIKTNIIVRITADCPLLDPYVIDTMLNKFHELRSGGVKVDYLSNTLERTYPRGLDVEIFSRASLERAYKEALEPYEREHVTPYLYRHPELFYLYSFKNNEDLSHYRWTLDTVEDWTFISEVYARLYNGKNIFTTKDVLELLRREPKLIEINSSVKQRN